MRKLIIIILLICAGETASAKASVTEQAAGPSTKTYALIVSGINKDPGGQRVKDEAVTKLRRFFLNNAKVEPNQLDVLVDRNSVAGKNSKISTAKNLKITMESLAQIVKPEDRFVFYYVGQANVVADKLRLNLPGEDVTHVQPAEWVSRIKADSILIVLDCPGAALAAKSMAGRGRIVICACKTEQHNSTQFSRYFVPALTDNKSDTNTDGKISLLEAFTSASKQLDDLYRRQQLFKTETPLLEDNGDGLPSPQPWRYKLDGKDGFVASNFYFGRNNQKK
jgi:hypothetical protein